MLKTAWIRFNPPSMGYTVSGRFPRLDGKQRTLLGQIQEHPGNSGGSLFRVAAGEHTRNIRCPREAEHFL
ncbi:hypothetical protein [Desulfobacter sp.]